jgi:hypothetical protein
MTNLVNMYDSTEVANLPAHGSKYAGYVNGDFKNHDAIQERFPLARVFGIDVFGSDWLKAAIVDFEKFDVQDKATLRKFIVNRNKFRKDTAVVYTDRDNLNTVEEFTAGLENSYWIATLDGTNMTGLRTASGKLIVATQIAGGVNAPFDVSTTLISWH